MDGLEFPSFDWLCGSGVSLFPQRRVSVITSWRILIAMFVKIGFAPEELFWFSLVRFSRY